MDRLKYFKSVKSARTYQKEHKKRYGYKPALFIKYGKKKVSRFMIIPKGLKRI
jgi:hypothetical protein